MNRPERMEVLTRLHLPEEEAQALFLKATAAGLTVPELLENFIGDLVGVWGNGSDERGHADAWFERCWFSDDYGREITFSMWLSRYGNLEDAFDILAEMEAIAADIDREDDHEELEALKDDLAPWEADLEDLLKEYTEDSYISRNSTKQGREAALEDLKATYRQYRALKDGDALEAPQEGGKDD